MGGASKPSTDRVPCAVPFCGRTTRRTLGPNQEHICCKHWPLVSRQSKRLLQHNRRRMLKRGETEMRLWLEYKLWKRCVHEAIERAVGITG